MNAIAKVSILILLALVTFQLYLTSKAPTAVSHSSTAKIRAKTLETIHEIVEIDGTMYQNYRFKRFYPWKNAKKYCDDLKLGGYDDWRLPTGAEFHKVANLVELGETNPHKPNRGYFIKQPFIKNMPPRGETTEHGALIFFYGSAKAEHDNVAWTAHFERGEIGQNCKSQNFYVMCVRTK
ncbi:MAG: DUF1566 domain-containing protein [Campylobacterota bacterium]|nr:DUF1566 domain-containing protein [Campylobacterota bacterium]